MDDPAAVRILAFDVFGTVADWHSGITAAVAAEGLPVDAAEFARAWRAGYAPVLARVRAGELGWTKLDALHRLILDDLLPRFGVPDLGEEQRRRLVHAWHRLDPWPDVVAGLTRLRAKYLLCTLSNGHLALLARLANHGGLPWDCLLSAEVFRQYKPEPAVYHGVASVFDVPEAEVMLVAAHHDDLAAARACGLRTAYVERPHEFGADAPKDVSPVAENSLHVRDFAELADVLGC